MKVLFDDAIIDDRNWIVLLTTIITFPCSQVLPEPVGSAWIWFKVAFWVLQAQSSSLTVERIS